MSDVQEQVQVEEQQPTEVTATEQINPVDEQVEKPEAKNEEQKVEQQQEDEHKDRENRVQKRIDKLTKEKYQHKAEADFYKRQLEQLAASQQQHAQPDNTGKPNRDSYGSDEEYVEALTEWKVDQKLGSVEQRRAQEQTQSTWSAKVVEAKKQYADWEEVMEEADDLPISAPMQQAIVESEYGTDVLYELAKNPDMSTRIAQLKNPIAVAREIGKIEAFIEQRKKAPKPEQKPKVSAAPEPIKPIKPHGSVEKDPSKMTPEEWARHRGYRK